MKLLRIAAVSCWALALAPVVGTAAQSSPTLDAYGWWSKTQALPVQGDPTGLGVVTVPTVPAPATVPEDGMYVSNDASGPAAFAAVRFRLDGKAGGTLTVRLPESAAPLTGTEEIAGCAVLGGFEPALNGRWDAAPAYDEARCVDAVVAEDGTSISVEAPADWASSLGDIAVAVVPKPGSVTPFSLALQAPADGDFAAGAAAPSSGSSFSPPPTSSGSSSFAPSKPPSFAAPSSPSVATPTTVATDEVASAPVAVPTTPAVEASAATSDAAKWFAVGLLVAIGAGMWVLSGQTVRAPRLLGSIGGGVATPAPAPVVRVDARPRGVGRFARPRSAPPTTI